MADTEQAPEAGPYATAAVRYLEHGWTGVLPLPIKAKTPPPNGYTGTTGTDPTPDEVAAWASGREGRGNLALRMPADLIGIDVDAYGLKSGRHTIESATANWGELPVTWRSTSRDDGISGIYLYRVPVGLRWPGEVGPGVEIIQDRHRYAVAWPSVHPTGQTYRWLSSEGLSAVDVPFYPGTIPELPATWIAGLTGGQDAQQISRSGGTRTELDGWAYRFSQGIDATLMCHAVAREVANAGVALSSMAGQSRHDAAMNASAALARFGGEGHIGVRHALSLVRGGFVDLVVGDGSRSMTDAQAEWMRMEQGALDIARAEHPDPAAYDPCMDPFAEILGRPSAPQVAGPLPQAYMHQPIAPAEPYPPHDIHLSDIEGTYNAECVTCRALAAAPLGRTDAAGMMLTQANPAGDFVQHDPFAMAMELAREQAIAVELARVLVQREARRQADDIETASTWREPLYVATLADELALPDDDIQWAVDEILPAGGNVLLAAQYKAGKTTLLSNLARSLADLDPFLGRYPVAEQVRVAIWNYEVGRGQYRRWLRDIGIQAPTMVSILNLRGHTISLTSKQGKDWAVAWLVEFGIRVWILDPYARAFNGISENDNTEVARFTDALDEIKQRAGVTELVLAAHTGRAPAEQGLERARGAARLDDWADVRWLLNATAEGSRYYRAHGRDVDTEESQLQFDPITRLLTLTDGKRPVVENKRKPFQKRDAGDTGLLVGIIAGDPGISRAGIQRELQALDKGMSSPALTDLLEQLSKPGQRLRRSSGTKGNAHAYYLADDFTDLLGI